MSGNLMRKMYVFDQLSKLDVPEEVKEKINKLYVLLNKIEFNKVLTFHLGAYVPTLIILWLPVELARQEYLSVEIVNEFLSNGFLILNIMALAWATCYLILRIAFIPKTKKVINEINQIFLFDSQSQDILKIIEKLDPDMIRNIGKILPKMRR